jgi:hypothetical protein
MPLAALFYHRHEFGCCRSIEMVGWGRQSMARLIGSEVDERAVPPHNDFAGAKEEEWTGKSLVHPSDFILSSFARLQ